VKSMAVFQETQSLCAAGSSTHPVVFTLEYDLERFKDAAFIVNEKD
jgi:hypothetical protein